MFGAKLCVHCWEVVPCSEGPLSEVPLYIIIYYLFQQWLEGDFLDYLRLWEDFANNQTYVEKQNLLLEMYNTMEGIKMTRRLIK